MKRNFRTISVFLLTFFLFNLVFLNSSLDNQQVQAASYNTDNESQPINILEIQPNRSFELKQNSFNASMFGNRTVNLTQMSMPEFISNNDYINGKYDIIYIGDNVGSDNIDYTNIGKKITNFDFIYVQNKYPQKLPYNYSSEQYTSENDITNKKAGFPLLPEQQKYSTEAGLKSFIESKQLTIFSNKIFEKNIDLKLKSLFKGYKDNNEFKNFKTVKTISADAIKQWYNNDSNISKRPILKITSKPTEYTGGESYINDRLLKFTFEVNNPNKTDNVVNPMKGKLYLDFDGDSLFREEECVKTIDIQENGAGYSLDFRLDDGFNGIMPWKVEIIDNVTGAKSYQLGNTAFQSTALKIRALQLTPNNNKYNLSSMSSLLAVRDKYVIDLTIMPVDEFNKSYINKTYKAVASTVVRYDSNFSSTTKKNQTVSTILNGNYDMIVLGFADTFGESKIAQTDEVANAIKDFVKTGQSIMFTHDTIAGHRIWGYENTKYFKDLAGQSRYNDKFIDPNLTNPREEAKPAGNVGFTNVTLDGGGTRTGNTFRLNQGVITQYPYVLGNIDVAKTHKQWQQLNLEDENVIPWYTLVAYDIDQYDGRNSYYTYSKGNVTFSGTGHFAESGSTTPTYNEQKLFVNTILKASRSANHAPTLEIINLADSQYFTKSQEKLDFSFLVYDVDFNDRMNAKIFINDTQVLVDEPSFVGIKSGTITPVSIPKTVIDSIVGASSNFNVKVLVTDSKGAEASKVIKLNYGSMPTFDLSADKQTYGALVGDTIYAALYATASTVDNPNINLQVTKQFQSTFDTSGLKAGSENSWTISNVTYSSDGTPNPRTQTKTLSFMALKQGEYKVNNTFSYKFNTTDSQEQTESFEFPISVKSSKIDIKVTADKGIVFPESVKVSLSKDNVTLETLTTENGFVSFTNKPTGTYKISVETPKGYALDSVSKDFTVELSYDNPEVSKEIKLVGNKPNKPILKSDITVPTNSSVTVTATYDNVPVKKISVDGGNTWFDYTGPVVIENNTVVCAKCQSESGLWSDIESLPITNIDKIAPTGKVKYSKVESTNQDVIATLVIDNDEEVTIISEGNSEIHVFSQNGTFEFKFKDAAGNIGTAIATVNNIDKVKPIGQVSYVKNSDGSYTATVTIINKLPGYAWVSNNGGSNQYILKNNNPFIFELEDKAGNRGEAVAQKDLGTRDGDVTEDARNR